MELIERYIYAVTRHLPADMQADVADELRSSIDAALEEKGSQSKKAVEEVLISLGDPIFLAQQFSGKPQFLIGPRFYWMYTRALKLALSIGLPIALGITVIIQIVGDPTSIPLFIGEIVSIVVGTGVQIIFWTTLVFFIMERAGVDDKELRSANPWTPAMLPPVAAKREIPISEAIADTVWYTLLAIFPFIANILAAAYADGKMTPVFNPEIWAIGTWIVVAFGVLGVVKSILKIKTGMWTKGLAIGNAIYAIAFSIFLIVATLSATLINPAFTALIDTHIATANLAEVTKGVDWTVAITITVTIGIYLYDAGKGLYSAFQKIDRS